MVASSRHPKFAQLGRNMVKRIPTRRCAKFAACATVYSQVPECEGTCFGGIPSNGKSQLGKIENFLRRALAGLNRPMHSAHVSGTGRFAGKKQFVIDGLRQSSLSRETIYRNIAVGSAGEAIICPIVEIRFYQLIAHVLFGDVEDTSEGNDRLIENDRLR